MSSAQAAAGTGRPAATVHTYSFTSLDKKDVNYSGTVGTGSDWDVNAKGKVVGFDVVSFVANTKTQKVTLYVAVSLPGGEMFGSGTGTFSSITDKGAILGGTGKYRGVKGTFVSKNLNKDGTKTAVTIKYTF
jgi:hypothetical protein